tara:strand:+ start:879 stop:1520 length:642 start_codon:yes stop_codon:yes gene_type:complete
MSLRLKHTPVAISPVWHPDFRNVDVLPHVGINRIVFMFNVLAVVMPILLCGVWIWVELEAFMYRSKNEELLLDIEERTLRNEMILEQDQLFQFASEKIKIVEAFYQTPVVPLDLLIQFSNRRPSGVIFQNISIAESGDDFEDDTLTGAVIHIQGFIEGVSTNALDVIDAYKQDLEQIPSVKNFIDKIEVVSLRRDVISQLFTYSIMIRLKEKE